MKIATLFGHRDFNDEKLRDKIKEMIIKIIKEQGIDTFYVGYNGKFDRFIAKLIYEIKKDFTHVKSYMILSRLNQKFYIYDKMDIDKEFDGTIFPPIEFVYPRFAISKRNEWMIEQAEVVFVYVKNKWGGAYNALKYAKRKKKKIINLAN